MDKHSEYLTKFSKLAEAAEYYLEESFDNIHKCLISELSGVIFQELLKFVDTTEKDEELIGKAEFSDNVIETLINEPPDVLTDNTHEKISSAWSIAQQIASIAGHNFQKNHKINSIELLGHLGNYAFFFETLINRHLLFLVVSKEMDEFTYNNLNRAKVLNRLTYIFKEELKTGKINLNEIANLYKLRNKTVHLTPDNAISIEAGIDALIRIWKQSQMVIKIFQKREKFNEVNFTDLIESEIKEFLKRWLNKDNKTVKELIEKVKEKLNKKEDGA